MSSTICTIASAASTFVWKNAVGDTRNETPATRFAHMASARQPHRLAADHVRSGPIVDVEIEAVGRVLGGEKRADRRAQRLVVAGDDEHGDRFAAVARGADDQVPEHAAQRRSRGGDLCAREMTVERERDVVGARLVHRTFGDRDDGARVHRVVADHAAAAVRAVAEDK